MKNLFSDNSIYGDDFTMGEIEQWYIDEAEAYTDLYVRNKEYTYGTHALNKYHIFRHIPKRNYHRVLGFGAAGGDEFLPILEQIQNLVIIEPSSLYDERKSVGEVPCMWVKPNVSGKLPFDNDAFDLVTCFSALHHIPNVSFVFGELVRVLRPGGYLLVREPVISMGDWRISRTGLTKRERGIPLPVFYKLFQNAQLEIVTQSRCIFPPIHILFHKMSISPYNHRAIVYLDAVLSNLFAWNYRYHRTKWWHKISPRSACFVLKKHE